MSLCILGNGNAIWRIINADGESGSMANGMKHQLTSAASNIKDALVVPGWGKLSHHGQTRFENGAMSSIKYGITCTCLQIVLFCVKLWINSSCGRHRELCMSNISSRVVQPPHQKVPRMLPQVCRTTGQMELQLQ